jgi:DNA repair protein RadC
VKARSIFIHYGGKSRVLRAGLREYGASLAGLWRDKSDPVAMPARTDILPSCPLNMVGIETALVLMFSREGEVLDQWLSQGEQDRLLLPISDLVQRAQARGARNLLLAHSHPSGDARPSAVDIETTRMFCSALRRRGLRLVDHLILARGQYFSFRMHRLL